MVYVLVLMFVVSCGLGGLVVYNQRVNHALTADLKRKASTVLAVMIAVEMSLNRQNSILAQLSLISESMFDKLLPRMRREETAAAEEMNAEAQEAAQIIRG